MDPKTSLLQSISSPFMWPGNMSAAVSMTYDDGNLNNLDIAIPDLEAAGIRGSFYLTTGTQAMIDRKNDWKAAHQRGHEIGNHSVHHPARAECYPDAKWLTHPLENYSPEDIRNEIHEAADWLDEHIGVDPGRSYAFPCGHTAIGNPPDEKSYRRAVSSRHRFARGARVLPKRADADEGINAPLEVDLLHIDGVGYWPSTDSFFFEAIESVRKTGGWLSLIFHGVGGPSHEVSRVLHQEIIKRLSDGSFWVAPVRDVAGYIEPFLPSNHHRNSSYTHDSSRA